MITEGGPFADLFRRKEGKGRKIDDDTKVITGEGKFYSDDEKVGLLGKLDINREKRSYVSEMKEMDSKEFFKTQRKKDLNKREQKGFDKAWRYHKRKTGLSFTEKLEDRIQDSKWGGKRFRKDKPFSLTGDDKKHGYNAKTTAWENYRGAVKEYREKEIKSQPLFSQERKEARKDFYGRRGWDTRKEQASTSLSIKNKYQQKMLQGKMKGQGGRGVHTPNIPVLKHRVSFADWRQDRQNREQANIGGTKYGWKKQQNTTNTAGAQTFCTAAGNCN